MGLSAPDSGLTHGSDNHIGILHIIDSLHQQRVGGVVAPTFIYDLILGPVAAAAICNAGSGELLAQGLHHGNHGVGAHAVAPGAEELGPLLTHRAHHSDIFHRLEGEEFFGVFQEHHRLAGKLTGHGEIFGGEDSLLTFVFVLVIEPGIVEKA